MASLDARTCKLLAVSSVLAFTALAGTAMAVVSTSHRAPGGGLRTAEAAARGPAAVEVPAPASATPAPAAPYEVGMSPVGTVRFARPPERIVTQDANYNDMLVAIGRGEKLIATGYRNNFYDGFYAQLPGVRPGIDPQAIRYLSGNSGVMFDKELLYQLRGDIHHIDPVQLASMRGWSAEAVAEVSRNVGPFFANRYSRENIYTGTEPYEFYDLWELSGRVAQVYRQGDRIAGLKRIGDALVQRIQDRLPPPELRPRVGLIHYGSSRITAYSLLHGGFGQAQYAAIGARDAFAGRNISTYGDGGGQGTALDLEGLLSVDPDVLIIPFAIYGAPGSGLGGRLAYEQFLSLKADPLGQRLSAFRHDQVHPGGTPLQGPVFYLFQVEMAAKQVYPGLFGRFREDQDYPPAERLFDREEVARILRGDADHGGG